MPSKKTTEKTSEKTSTQTTESNDSNAHTFTDSKTTYVSKDDNILLNTLRQTIYKYIPTYAFHPNNIDITTNTSVHNNDYLRLRISNFACEGIENSRALFDEVINARYKEIIVGESRKVAISEYEDFDFGELMERETNGNYDDKDGQDDDIVAPTLTMFCDVEASGDDIVKFVTTDDCRFVLNGETIDSPFKNPLLICKLRTGQKLVFSADSSYDIGMANIIYTPVSICYFKQLSDKWNLCLETNQNQLEPDEIVLRAMRIICLKTLEFRELVERIVRKHRNVKLIESEGSFTLPNDQFCMTNILIDTLQSHPDVEYAGYKIPHLLKNEAQINYRMVDKNKSIAGVMNNVIRDIETRCKTFCKENKIDLGDMKLLTSHINMAYGNSVPEEVFK